MIFIEEEKVDKEILKTVKYFGKCKDKKGEIWIFYTNSLIQFDSFKKNKRWNEMKLIEAK